MHNINNKKNTKVVWIQILAVISFAIMILACSSSEDVVSPTGYSSGVGDHALNDGTQQTLIIESDFDMALINEKSNNN